MREADLKRAVADYLQYGQNQGKWMFLRLNSGEAFVKRGGKFYKVQLCEKGTADHVVFERLDILKSPTIGSMCWACRVVFLEEKGETGKQSPEQKVFQEEVEAMGAEYYLVYSVEQVKEVLK